MSNENATKLNKSATVIYVHIPTITIESIQPETCILHAGTTGASQLKILTKSRI